MKNEMIYMVVTDGTSAYIIHPDDFDANELTHLKTFSDIDVASQYAEDENEKINGL
jgi:hypothetical protein